MKIYKELTKSEKDLVNAITDEAWDLIKSHAKGYGFIRINMYTDAVKELILNGETELEICGAHCFTNSNSDDIDKENQVEIVSFEQDDMSFVEGDGDWTDTERGQGWLRETFEIAKQNVINFLFNTK